MSPNQRKKKTTIIKKNENAIAVSKQLSKRRKNGGSSRIRTTPSSNKNNDPTTLAELENSYEDSDESLEEPKGATEMSLSPKFKNIFNAENDEIPERLKENDVDSDGSNDSHKTYTQQACVAYTQLSGRPHSFSPTPGTSKDNETFLKNVQSYNEWKISENGNNVSQNDIEIIDITYETIVIDDDSFIQPTKEYNDKDSEDSVEIIEPLDTGALNPMKTEESDSEDSVQFIDSNSPICLDNYISIDLNESFECCHDVKDIKIDELIRENNRLLRIFANKFLFNVINHLKPKSNLHNKTREQTNTSSSITANLNNISLKQETNSPPDQTRWNPGGNMSSRITKLTTPDEDKPNSSRNFSDCPICMESLSNKVVASTVCGHIFCLKCLKDAIKTRGKKCPTCRKSLGCVGYHKLFL